MASRNVILSCNAAASIHISPGILTKKRRQFPLHADAVEGVFVFLGIGNDSLQTNQKLHTPRFKMDDSMMPVGAALHASMALQYLSDNQPKGSGIKGVSGHSKRDEL